MNANEIVRNTIAGLRVMSESGALDVDRGTCIDAIKLLESLTAQLAVRDAEIDRLTEALEIAKRGHVDCMSAERQADGKCLGYGRGENDDEPCAQCSNCPQCTAYEPERKPINEWAALDGICVLDPDGFDRSDPYVLEREITKAEYLAGIWRCTVMPLPAAPEEGKQI